VSVKALAVAIIGAGPAGLMAAERLSAAGVSVSIYERMASPARKFLMAGRGGLNLTHSEDLPRLLTRYGAAQMRLTPAIAAFPPAALRDWAHALGQPTFVGSSGRVFPRSLKASPLLRAWLSRLGANGVRLVLRRTWLGWDAAGHLVFRLPDGSQETASPDATILALGGASWPRLGADGGWVGLLAAKGVAVAPLRPANCGFAVDWTDSFRERFAGQPLKNIALTWDGRTVRGEAVVTDYGIEGGAIYALSAVLRDAIEGRGPITLHVDLRPDMSHADLMARLAQARQRETLANVLRKAANLPPVAINLLREAIGPALSRDPAALAALVKSVPLLLRAPQPLARAISTAGGIGLDELDAHFMLRALPGVFAAGEMLDWEAPTGGYLLQACFATGRAAAEGALHWLGQGTAART
jgi:uncharacterized flavoprotein (TIGR03862 family)